MEQKLSLPQKPRHPGPGSTTLSAPGAQGLSSQTPRLPNIFPELLALTDTWLAPDTPLPAPSQVLSSTSHITWGWEARWVSSQLPVALPERLSSLSTQNPRSSEFHTKRLDLSPLSSLQGHALPHCVAPLIHYRINQHPHPLSSSPPPCWHHLG